MSRASRKRQYRRRAGALRDEVKSLTTRLDTTAATLRYTQLDAQTISNQLAGLAVQASDIGITLEFTRDPTTLDVVIRGERLVHHGKYRTEVGIGKHELALSHRGGLVLHQMLRVVHELKESR